RRDRGRPAFLVRLAEESLRLAADHDLARVAETLTQSATAGRSRRRWRSRLCISARRQNQQRATKDEARNGLRHHWGQKVPLFHPTTVSRYGGAIKLTAYEHRRCGHAPTALQPAAENEVDAVDLAAAIELHRERRAEADEQMRNQVVEERREESEEGGRIVAVVAAVERESDADRRPETEVVVDVQIEAGASAQAHDRGAGFRR